MIQRRSSKYISYQKSFERAFSTNPEQGMMDTGNTPSLPTVTDSVPRQRRQQKKKNATRRHITKDGTRDAPLRPVVLRGSSGLNVDNNPRVHLPPITIQVRDILAKDPPKQLTRAQVRPPRTPQEKPSTTEARKKEQLITMKEFSVLPPIGKKPNLCVGPEEANKKKVKLRKSSSNSDAKKEKLNLEEALQQINKDTQQSHRGFQDSRQAMVPDMTLDSQKEVKLPSAGFLNLTSNPMADNDVQLHDIGQKKKKLQLPKPPSDIALNNNKRRKGAYITQDIENEYEKEMINWCRAGGRRAAICEELDLLYQDLAIIVKHNLLIQHLEEICMF